MTRAAGAGVRPVVHVWLSRLVAHRTGDLLLRTAAGELIGTDPAAVDVGRECPGCAHPERAPHGRPVLPGTGLAASVSRSSGLVAVALAVTARAAGAVGVDVELGDAAGLAATVLGASEAAPDAAGLRISWCRKEAVLKATGDGLRVDPRAVRVSAPDEAPELVTYAGRRLAVTLADLPVPGGAGAVALLGRHRAGLDVRLRLVPDRPPG